MAKPIKFRKKWRIRWSDENGRRLSEIVDSKKDAQFKLQQHQLAVEEVKRGLRKPLVVDKTFADLCSYWMEKRAALKRSRKDDESIIRRHLMPVFGGLKVRDFATGAGSEKVYEFIAARSSLSKKTVGNHLTLLISMLNLAHEIGWLVSVPRIRKPKARLFSRDYQYLRTEREIRRFIDATLDEGEVVHALYATAVYTGMRAGELAGLRWSDIDLARRLITVQRSFDGPTKADDLRYVPILDPLLPLLRSWRLRCPGKVVFPNRDGNILRPSGRVFQEVLHRVLKRAEFPRVKRSGKLRPHITFHGLRHTFASHWMMRGGEIFKLQKILGHKSLAMTQRYAHLAPEAFAGDYSRLGDAHALETASVIKFELPSQ